MFFSGSYNVENISATTLKRKWITYKVNQIKGGKNWKSGKLRWYQIEGLNFDHEDISKKQKNFNLIVLNEYKYKYKKEIHRKLIKIDDNRLILVEAVTSKFIKMENSHLN